MNVQANPWRPRSVYGHAVVGSQSRIHRRHSSISSHPHTHRDTQLPKRLSESLFPIFSLFTLVQTITGLQAGWKSLGERRERGKRKMPKDLGISLTRRWRCSEKLSRSFQKKNWAEHFTVTRSSAWHEGHRRWDQRDVNPRRSYLRLTSAEPPQPSPSRAFR